MLRNLKFIFPIIAIYIINCYATRSSWFMIQQLWKHIYVLGILPYQIPAWFINSNEINAKDIVFLDDVSVAGSLNRIEDYWDKLTALGPKYGYLPKPMKFYLIVKENKLMKVQKLFANSRVNITAEGKRQLGAVVGSAEYRDEYVKDLVKKWDFINYFVNYCRNTTASSLFSICQLV